MTDEEKIRDAWERVTKAGRPGVRNDLLNVSVWLAPPAASYYSSSIPPLGMRCDVITFRRQRGFIDGMPAGRITGNLGDTEVVVVETESGWC